MLGRVGLNSTVRSRISSKLSKYSGPSMNCAIARRLLAVHSGRDVDEHQRAHDVGRAVGERDRRQAAERHADDEPGVGRELAHRLLERDGVLRGPVGVIGLVRRVTMAGEVERDERDGRARARRCPRCARSAHRRGSAPAPAAPTPQTSALIACPSPTSTATRRDLRVTAPRDAELLGILVEQSELVVGARAVVDLRARGPVQPRSPFHAS